MPTHLVPDLDETIARSRESFTTAIDAGSLRERLQLESARIEVRMLLPDLDPRTPPAAIGAALIGSASHAAAVLARVRTGAGAPGMCRDAAVILDTLLSFAVAFIELGEEQDAAAAGGDGR